MNRTHMSVEMRMARNAFILLFCLMFAWVAVSPARAEGQWEVTPESERAAELGLEWLAKNQGTQGNWRSNDLGLVALGVMAFLSAGHTPGVGKYGDNINRGLDYIVSNQKPSGLLNIADAQRDMYNHGLSTFVLTQVYGMSPDKRIGKALDKALKLIADVQCDNGGWEYKAIKRDRGHDLSLAVMQAKALRGAMDVGMEISPRTVKAAIQGVQSYYRPQGEPDGKGHLYGNDPLASRPGQFTYDGNRPTPAMGAAGAVCLQEFGMYGDFRIYRSVDAVIDQLQKDKPKYAANGEYTKKHNVPFQAYTLYYLSQALYQIGGDRWRQNYPVLRDALVRSQIRDVKQRESQVKMVGSWNSAGLTGGNPYLFATSVAVFTLNIPNRYLPILQQGQEKPGQKTTVPDRMRSSSAVPQRKPVASNAPTVDTKTEVGRS